MADFIERQISEDWVPPKVSIVIKGAKESPGGLRFIPRKEVTQRHRVIDVFSNGSALVSDMTDEEFEKYLGDQLMRRPEPPPDYIAPGT